MKNSNIGEYPGYKYYTLKVENGGALRGYRINVSVKDTYYNTFIDQPIEVGYSGPLSGRRDLQDDGVKLCTCDISNRSIRIASTAVFSAAQPDHDIGIVLKIPAEIENKISDYITATLSYDNRDPQSIISDKPEIRRDFIQSGTKVSIPNKYFG